MKAIIVTAALALSVAAPASASDQLARNLGLDPGAFSSAELATIKGGRESGVSTDRQSAAVFEALAVRGVAPTREAGAAGGAQLAANLGLDAGLYTSAELAEIKGVVEAHSTADTGSVAYLTARDGTGLVSTQSVGASGSSAQLADNLGVDPADYTLAELAVLKGQFEAN